MRLEVREEKQHFYAGLFVTMLLKTILDYCFKHIFKLLLLLKKYITQRFIFLRFFKIYIYF